MKKIISQIKILTFLLFSFSMLPNACFARHGSLGTPLDEILIGILFFFIVYISYASHKIKNKTKKVKTLLKEMARLDPKWEEKNLVAFTKETFLVVQQAKIEHNLQVLKSLLHPKLYAHFEKNFSIEIRTHFRKIWIDLDVRDVQIVNVKRFLLNKKFECFIACIITDAKKQTILDRKIKDTHFCRLREFWTFLWENNQWVLYQIEEFKNWKNFVASDSLFEKRNKDQ